MTCAAFKGQLRRTYGFRPAQLDAQAQARKIELMDGVWNAVHRESAALGPCLKEALAGTTDDGWFLFDGGQLLVAVDDSRDAKELLLKGLARVELDDVDLRTWVARASRLGLDGLDTAELGRRWLLYPEAKYFLPEHVYEVDRGTGARFLFGAADERFATPVLTRLAREATDEVKETAVWLLMSQATPEALGVLRGVDRTGLSQQAIASLDALAKAPRLIEPRAQPKTTRAELVAAFTALLRGDEAPFERLVEAVPDGERDVVAVCTAADLELLRKVRRYYAAKNNPHALDFYDQFSQIIMTLVWETHQKQLPQG